MEQQTEAVTVAKRRIRQEVRARRRSLSPAERAAAADALTGRLVDLVRGADARSVSCYLALPTEPDTSGFLDWATAHDIEVLLPTSLPEYQLGWIRLDGGGTVEGAHGIREPVGEVLPGTAAGEVDLMLIPAAAVDHRGMRLGWGLGYYDRCIASLDRTPPLFAIVHDGDVLPVVPAESHDSPVTGVITPSGTRRFDDAVRDRL